ncbi:hypothetical protein BH11ARM1_BH11ARM1_03890 [soil metagenome]
MRNSYGLAILGFGVLLAGCSSGGDATPETTVSSTPVATVSYAPVQAVLTKNCISCHSGASPADKIDMSTYDGVIKGHPEGPIVVAGDVEKSKIIEVLKVGAKPHMPPKEQLSDVDQKMISDWIAAGAKQG